MVNPSKLLLLFFCLASFAKADPCLAAEQITITTFYPAPNGVYGELRSKRLAIGNRYYDPGQFCWPGGPCPQEVLNQSGTMSQLYHFSDDTSLAVEGRVVIGNVNVAAPARAGLDGNDHAFATTIAGLGPRNNNILADDVYLNSPADGGPNRWVSDGFFYKTVAVRNNNQQAPQVSGRSFRITVADDNAGQNNIYADDVYLHNPADGGSPRWASQGPRMHACWANWGGWWAPIEGRNVYVRPVAIIFDMPGNDIIGDFGPSNENDSVAFFCVSEDGGPYGYTGICLTGESCPWWWG